MIQSLTHRTGAFFPLFGGLNASVIWGLDWDKSPPDGTKETDHSLDIWRRLRLVTA